jgi:hypothetical protein
MFLEKVLNIKTFTKAGSRQRRPRRVQGDNSAMSRPKRPNRIAGRALPGERQEVPGGAMLQLHGHGSLNSVSAAAVLRDFFPIPSI